MGCAQEAQPAGTSQRWTAEPILTAGRAGHEEAGGLTPRRSPGMGVPMDS